MEVPHGEVGQVLLPVHRSSLTASNRPAESFSITYSMLLRYPWTRMDLYWIAMSFNVRARNPATI